MAYLETQLSKRVVISKFIEDRQGVFCGSVLCSNVKRKDNKTLLFLFHN